MSDLTVRAPLKALYDVPAPAKLNLFLHITGRRADDYHLLQSVFMLIDWCDTLHFELRRDGVISRTDQRMDVHQDLPAEDLSVRAARALQAATDTLHNRAMRRDAQEALVQVREGAPLAAALAAHRRFPTLLTMFARLGEQTGTLPAMLQRAAVQLGGEVQRRAMQMA
ncbi:MAG: type II secretion system F family protein, partial [Polaromonas sp.]|nr:type II secretion system F family protein [Polaromonas sp.]